MAAVEYGLGAFTHLASTFPPNIHVQQDGNGQEAASEDASGGEAGEKKEHQPSKPYFISCLENVQLSPDGSCIFTADRGRAFSVYAYPTWTADGEVERASAGVQHLVPYAKLAGVDPIWAFAANPYFDMYDRDTTQVLISRKGHYVAIHNALWDESGNAQNSPQDGPVDISTKLASYKLGKSPEEPVSPHSLAWTNEGIGFYAGCKQAISLFDIEHTFGPIRTIDTSNKDMGMPGYKGDVAALSVCPSSAPYCAGMLAAGTRTSSVGLYDARSSYETHVNLRSTNIQGSGVSQLQWSADGNYLIIAERMSNALLIYDVRSCAFSLAHCEGRLALAQQNMRFDMVSGNAHTEIWAGGSDGTVRIWHDPWNHLGGVRPVQEIQAGMGPASSVVLHPQDASFVVSRGKYEVGKNVPGSIFREGVNIPPCGEWGVVDVWRAGEN